MTTRIRRHEKTKQTILDAALRLISKNGINALSMRDIAGEIDYSAAGLYEYFDSKEEILLSLCGQGHLQLSAAMNQVDKDLAPVEYLIQIGQAYIQFALDHPEHYLLMFTNVPAKTELASMMVEGSSFPILLNAIQRGIETGSLHARPDFGLYEMAYSAWAVVHGISMLRLTYLENYALDFERADREMLEALYRGFQSG